MTIINAPSSRHCQTRWTNIIWLLLLFGQVFLLVQNLLQARGPAAKIHPELLTYLGKGQLCWTKASFPKSALHDLWWLQWDQFELSSGRDHNLPILQNWALSFSFLVQEFPPKPPAFQLPCHQRQIISDFLLWPAGIISCACSGQLGKAKKVRQEKKDEWERLEQEFPRGAGLVKQNQEQRSRIFSTSGKGKGSAGWALNKEKIVISQRM